MIRKTTIKIWSAIGAVAVSGAVAAPAGAADEFAGGTLDKALEKVFAGEGGEGGLGFTTMTRSFSVPALTESQLRTVFTGNTLSSRNKVAAFLRSDGKIEGWYSVDREVQPFERCPAKDFERDNLFTHAGHCMHRSYEQFKGGETWSVKGGQICLPESASLSDAKGCYNAALVLNSVVLFGDDGKMIGKGRDLSKGKNVPAMPANKPLK